MCNYDPTSLIIFCVTGAPSLRDRLHRVEVVEGESMYVKDEGWGLLTSRAEKEHPGHSDI